MRIGSGFQNLEIEVVHSNLFKIQVNGCAPGPVAIGFNLDEAKEVQRVLQLLIDKVEDVTVRQVKKDRIIQLQNINERLMDIYRADDEIEDELDEATDHLNDAIHILRSKYE